VKPAPQEDIISAIIMIIIIIINSKIINIIIISLRISQYVLKCGVKRRQPPLSEAKLGPFSPRKQNIEQCGGK